MQNKHENQSHREQIETDVPISRGFQSHPSAPDWFGHPKRQTAVTAKQETVREKVAVVDCNVVGARNCLRSMNFSSGDQGADNSAPTMKGTNGRMTLPLGRNYLGVVEPLLGVCAVILDLEPGPS